MFSGDHGTDSGPIVDDVQLSRSRQGAKLKNFLRDISPWLKRLLFAQVLVSAGSVLAYGVGFDSSLGYSLVIGLLPIALIVAFAAHLPFAYLILKSYSVATAVLGVLILAILGASGYGEWLSMSRLVLCAQVAVAVFLMIALTGGKDVRQNFP